MENISIDPYENDPVVLGYRSLGKVLASMATTPSQGLEENLSELMTKFAISSKEQNVCLELGDSDKDSLNWLEESGLAVRSENLTPDEIPNVPFIIDTLGKSLRLYLQRHFLEEKNLAKVLYLLSVEPAEKSEEVVDQVLAEFEKTNSTKKPSAEQQQTVRDAVSRNLSIITGGPGTGKTSIVSIILECLLRINPYLDIKMAAPTGKAVSRLKDSLSGEDSFAKKNEEILGNVLKAQDRIVAHTIHSWLLAKNERDNRPDSKHPLEADVFIVDEASMIDSALAARFFSVIDPARTKVIILGDKHQLAAVGPGAIFAAISDEQGPLKDSLNTLRESFRFGNKTPIGQLSAAINAQCPNDPQSLKDHFAAVEEVLAKEFPSETEQSIAFKTDPVLSEIQLSKTAEEWLREKLDRWIAVVKKHLISGKQPKSEELKECWEVLVSFGALAACRKGAQSVEAINNFCEAYVKNAISEEIPSEVFYPGKVIIVRKNDYDLDVMNGDVGFFYRVKGQEGESDKEFVYIGEKEKSVRSTLLPRFDTAFAITIHQSQGSGYTDVAVFLPNISEKNEDQNERSLATRELVYTGITRAKKSCTIFGSRRALEIATNTVTKRSGGLTDRLQELFDEKANPKSEKNDL